MDNSLRRLKLNSSYAISRYMGDISRLAMRNLAPKVVAVSAQGGPLASYVMFIWDRVDDAGKFRTFIQIGDRLKEICLQGGGE